MRTTVEKILASEEIDKFKITGLWKEGWMSDMMDVSLKSQTH